MAFCTLVGALPCNTLQVCCAAFQGDIDSQRSGVVKIDAAPWNYLLVPCNKGLLSGLFDMQNVHKPSHWFPLNCSSKYKTIQALLLELLLLH